MLSTDKAWEKFGREEPYFGVLADEKFTREQLDRNRDEFFASGEGAVAEIIDRFERHFGQLGRGRVLDHGCGVGRLSIALARRFHEVVALDVSPSMLREAEANTRAFNATNIRLAQADDVLSNGLGTFDFVNSHMVLQHVPVGRGLRILSSLVDRVAPGGGFHFHLSIRTDGIASRALWWASHHIPGVKIWQNICAGRRWDAPAMQMNDYPLNEVIALLAAREIGELVLTTEKQAHFLTVRIVGKRARL